MRKLDSGAISGLTRYLLNVNKYTKQLSTHVSTWVTHLTDQETKAHKSYVICLKP